MGIYNWVDWLMLANHPDVPWKPIHPSALMFGIVAGSYKSHPLTTLNYFRAETRESISALERQNGQIYRASGKNDEKNSMK